MTDEEREAWREELRQAMLDRGIDPGSANRLSYALAYPEQIEKEDT